MYIRHFIGITTIGLFLSASGLAQDQATISSAREVARQGMDAFDAGRFEEAAEKLGRAYQVVKVPSLALARARALKQLGRLVEASELYLDATQLELGVREKPKQRAIQQAAQADAEEERRELLGRIPKLVIEIEEAELTGVNVTIDATAVPTALLGNARPVDPGTRQVVATRGLEKVRRAVTLQEGETKTIRLKFAAIPPVQESSPTGPNLAAAPSQHAERRELLPHQRTIGWVGIGVGGAGLIFGSVMGLRVKSQRSSLDQQGCVSSHCYSEQQDAIDSYNSSRTMSTVGFVVGAVGLAAGATLLLTAPANQAVTAWISPGSVGMKGRF